MLREAKEGEEKIDFGAELKAHLLAVLLNGRRERAERVAKAAAKAGEDPQNVAGVEGGGEAGDTVDTVFAALSFARDEKGRLLRSLQEAHLKKRVAAALIDEDAEKLRLLERRKRFPWRWIHESFSIWVGGGGRRAGGREVGGCGRGRGGGRRRGGGGEEGSGRRGIRRTRRIMQLYGGESASAIPWGEFHFVTCQEKLEKVKKEVEKLVEKKKKAKREDLAEEDKEVFRAFVSCHRAEDCDLLIDEYRMCRFTLGYAFQAYTKRFQGKRIVVTRAPEPSNLLWENQILSRNCFVESKT